MSTDRDIHRPRPAWMNALRGSWTALCAAAAVVLGPATHTASTLVQANAAPLRHAPDRERGPVR
ncbi:hypothetical protein ABZ918_28570 [Streptomyces viridosporus]|uniref:Predicted protein n=1 Tax=Streptomyces viridosporus (strain ATCC 14672 / DSM 40746 / JCM 4963 / KCTC 9882 / NRRL B-12104 / FH 1290) TaxID=566461 RepID=D6A852_STRV1|nr:hypothetical protein [Streptomyces viridosporus]EFE69932.1 predicted protein [Streptomyces viridosporus ATCC 14672]